MRVIDHLRNSLSRKEFVKALKYFNGGFLLEHKTASSALFSAFIFSKTDEGYEYWGSIYDRLYRKDHPEHLPKEVKTFDAHIPSCFMLNQKQIASLFEHKKAKRKLLEWFAEGEEEKEEKEFVTDFEVGKWYWSDEHTWLFNYQGNENAFGINHQNEWDNNWIMYTNYKYIPATPEQIKEALVKEAKKRGFVDVDKLKIINIDGVFLSKGMFINNGNKFTYNTDEDLLQLDGVKIYNKGKWATIL